ncbi:MAG TPA: ThiF family adenylyltransferase [Haliangiales bacterium]|nr:ThiF family adenylyltransferase [Haliangiales bacterium]
MLLLGQEAQERLLAAAVAVDDAAGAGAAALLYLAAAGVGMLVVTDARAVAPEDVGLLYEVADVGRPRAAAAAERLAALNPDARVTAGGDAAHRVAPIAAVSDADALARGAAAAGAIIREIAGA